MIFCMRNIKTFILIFMVFLMFYVTFFHSRLDCCCLKPTTNFFLSSSLSNKICLKIAFFHHPAFYCEKVTVILFYSHHEGDDDKETRETRGKKAKGSGLKSHKIKLQMEGDKDNFNICQEGLGVWHEHIRLIIEWLTCAD